jgi:deazaflavin-dependent oxidoreductase (nitroreductase family)
MTQDNGRPVAGSHLVPARANWLEEHRQLYLTDPRKAHYNDLRDMGGFRFMPSLLLKTIGRKSGKTYFNPLAYFVYGPEVMIAASKGGHAEHPYWYLNLCEMKEIRFRIADDVFVGPWRQLEGAERAKVWDFLEVMYPPFEDYKNATSREIPVIALQWREMVETL